MADPISTVSATELAGSVHDISAWGMFLQADWVVQLVMFVLILASFWCWVIIFDKILRLRRVNLESTFFESKFWSGSSLDTLFSKLQKNAPDPMSAVFAAAMAEWKRADIKNLTLSTKDAILQRIERTMDITITREMERLERYVIFLATTGSVAPFLGLFGTVWGIMNSFTAIAATQNTSLAAVAPGIAEALFATAVGLVAAIPAVVAYNKISSDLARYAGRMEAFAGEFVAIISRQLDEKSAGKKAA